MRYDNIFNEPATPDDETLVVGLKEYKEGDTAELCMNCWDRNTLTTINGKRYWHCFNCDSNILKAVPPKRLI